jgi:hypothetical protein
MASKEVTPTPRLRRPRSPVIRPPVSRAEGTLVTRHWSLVTAPKALPSPAPQRPAQKVSLGKNVPNFKPISENQ